MTEGIAEGYGLKSLDDMPMVPAGRAGRPEEIADVIVFLSSENASFVNGVTWQIAGGMYC
jgi:NAD(P)-dependent dehydrogenase (short-subunit alcohol dehydrogenase family)